MNTFTGALRKGLLRVVSLGDRIVSYDSSYDASFGHRRLFVGLGLLLACGGLVACQAAAADSSGKPAAETNRLVIYSGRKESLVEPIIDQFRQASGIDVQVRYGGTAELAGVLLEEGANSPADVYYAQDPGGLGAVQAAGLLAQLSDTTLAAVPERFASPVGEWVGISGRARTVVYNTEAIADPATELPQDLWGFTAPEWKGRLVGRRPMALSRRWSAPCGPSGAKRKPGGGC